PGRVQHVAHVAHVTASVPGFCLVDTAAAEGAAALAPLSRRPVHGPSGPDTGPARSLREQRMPIAASEVRWVEEPKIGLFEQLYLPAIVEGLQTTVRHMGKVLAGRGTLTRQFPEQRPHLPPNYRGVHRLNRDDKGRVRCVACYM